MDVFKDAGFLTFLGVAVTSLAGMIGAWFTGRWQTKAAVVAKAPTPVEWQSQMDLTLEKMLGHHRQLIEMYKSDIDACRAQLAALSQKVSDYADKLDATERKLDVNEREIEDLTAYIGELTALMQAHKIEVPARRRRAHNV